jgi:hypothetical protein
MDTKQTINELYQNLHAKGIVSTRKEFYNDWLNRSECYFRYLKLKDKKPSSDALAICSSKLKHYSILLKQNHHAVLADEFATYSNKLDAMIFSNSKSKWMNLMNTNTEPAH